MSEIHQYPSLMKRIQDLLAVCSSEKFAENDLFLSAMASYICVLQSGLVEHAMREILSEYATGRAYPDIAQFARAKLGELQNANPERIRKCIGQFGDAKLQKLRASWADGEMRDHIGSIVANRHRIAHGGSSTVTVHTVLAWQSSVEKFIAFLEMEFAGAQ